MSTVRVLLLLGVLSTGCFAAPPAPATEAMLSGCHPGSHGARGELRCRRHSDCVLCGCERLETRAGLMRANPTCPQPITCDERPACCGGRCVVSLGPPPL